MGAAQDSNVLNASKLAHLKTAKMIDRWWLLRGLLVGCGSHPSTTNWTQWAIKKRKHESLEGREGAAEGGHNQDTSYIRVKLSRNTWKLEMVKMVACIWMYGIHACIYICVGAQASGDQMSGVFLNQCLPKYWSGECHRTWDSLARLA